jgi:hypothetical protein
MNLDEVQNRAIETYLQNMEFLKKHSPVLYNKVLVLDEGLNSELIPETYQLEFKDNKYFDIFNTKDESWFYSKDSYEYSKEITKNMDLDLEVNSFKTFYEYHYEEGVLEKVKNATIISSTVFGNAPIVDYINNNLSKKRISKQIFCYMIFGVGLGLHIPIIQQKMNAKLYCIVEPSLEIFRLSLFTTSYEEIAKKSQIIFFVSTDKETFTTKFREFHDQAYLYNHYIKFFLFSKTCEVYFEGIQAMLASQSHNMFAYDRELLSLTETAKYVQDDFNFFKVNKRADLKSLKDLPLLILAGGPSLKKNIDFIRENQKKFIIMSIFSLSPFLEENDIYPDIFTNYDGDEEAFVKKIYDKVKNKDYFKEKIFLFSSHVSKKLVDLFPKERIYFFNALYPLKKDYGILTGPSIGEMTYALGLILGFENIYLLGLDLALDSLSGKSHFEGYNESSQFEVNRDASLEKFSFRKNVFAVKGNLQSTVETTTVFYISIRQLNLYSKIFNPDKKLKVYNLSEGAYFDDIIPVEKDNLDLTIFEDLEKNDLFINLKENLDEISSKEFTEDDYEYVSEKLSDAKHLKKDIEEILLNNKHSSIEKYLICLEDLDDILKSKKYKCEDLINISMNYSRHNLPYLFFFFSLRNLDNPKAHIKKLNKILFQQISKVVDYYVNLLEKVIDKK